MKQKIKEYAEIYHGVMSKADWLLMLIVSVFCFLTMYYADITVTGQYGLTFLDSLFDGRLFSFYENALSSGIAPEGAVYDIGTYIIFGIWSLPVWICHRIVGLSALSVGSLMWFKLLPVLFFVASIRQVTLIAQDLRCSVRRSAEVSLIYLLSSTAFFPVMVVAQYDVIPLYFMLRGIHFYMMRDQKKFLFFFAISMTVKPLTILVLFLLILLREKNVFRILISLLEGCSLMILCKLCYGFNEAYRTSCGGFMAKNLPNLLNASIPGSYGTVSIFILLLFLIYISAYMSNAAEMGVAENRWMILMAYGIWASFCTFGSMTPYWAIYLAPFAVLTVCLCRENVDRLLLVDLIANIALTVLLIMKFPWVYGGDHTYSYLLLKTYCINVRNGEQGTTIAGILRHLSVENLIPVIGAVMAACFVYIGYAAWKELKCQPDLSEDGGADEHICVWQFRSRILLLGLWIVMTLGALVLTIKGY